MCSQAADAKEGKGIGGWIKAQIPAEHSNIAAAANMAFSKSCYLQCNMRFDDEVQLPESVATLLKMREAFAEDEWGWQHAVGATDALRATTLFFGRKGTRTGLHLDNTEAVDVAFATTQPSTGNTNWPR